MAESIAAFDYLRDLSGYRAELDSAISRVLDSGKLILGPEVHAFEQEFAATLGVQFAVGVASGTDALILALRALGVGTGEEVITVANTAVPTVSAIRAVGARPKFVDIEPATLQMNPQALSCAITSATRCILPVHLHGYPADMRSIEAIAAAASVPVIGDCAQAHAAAIAGLSVANFASINCYSFYPTKNLGALGDGGMCVTNSRELAHKLAELRQYGFRDDRIAHSEGVCSRLDELQAAVLRVRLRHLENSQQQRERIAERYLAGLTDYSVSLPNRAQDVTHGWHQFVIRTPHRTELCRRLQNAGIGYGIHYPVPIHRMPAYRFLGYCEGDLPHTEQAAGEVLSLPIYPGLRDEEVERVIAVVRTLLRPSTAREPDTGIAP